MTPPGSSQDHEDAPDLAGAWCLEQLLPWSARPRTRQETSAAIAEAQRSRPLAVYALHGRDVQVRSSPTDGPAAFAFRTGLYRDFLTAVLSEQPLDDAVELGLELGDGAPPIDAPIFTFQKTRGSRHLLLPDLDLLKYDFYEPGPHDTLSFADKQARAAFHGSTTGGDIDLAAVEAAALPRLSAARFFCDREEVTFALTHIVQATDEAREALRAQGHGRGPIGWEEAFTNAFLLSVDGNGAALSRPAIALLSNAALLRYDSEYVLNYSSSLVPWLHFVPISRHQDVLDIVALERAEPGRFAGVAREGQRFARQAFRRSTAVEYTARLLRGYAAACWR